MIAILGGGISGLVAAYELKKAGKEFVLLEASSEVGGKIKTRKKEGFIIEAGPNTVLVNNVETKKLLEELNIWDKLIFPNEDAVNSRFVLKNNSLEPIPTSIKGAIKSKLINGSTLYSILKEPFLTTVEHEESLADFIKRRLGNQIFEDLVTPFVTGIYAGNPEEMSSRYVLNILKEAEQKHGSILKGLPKLLKSKKELNEPYDLPKQKIFSFKNGLLEIIQALEKQFKNSIKYNSKVTALKKVNDQYSIEIEGDSTPMLVDKVICCLPAHATAKVVQTLSKTLSENLLKIPYVSAVSISLAVNKTDLSFKKPAFGILSRVTEKVPFLGVLFNSRFFPHTSPSDIQELITVIAGGSRNSEFITKTDQEIKNEILKSLKTTIGLEAIPLFFEIKRWTNGIPQYNLGYNKIEKVIDTFLNEEPNFKIAANFYKGVSVSDCIKNGTLVAKQFC